MKMIRRINNVNILHRFRSISWSFDLYKSGSWSKLNSWYWERCWSESWQINWPWSGNMGGPAYITGFDTSWNRR